MDPFRNALEIICKRAPGALRSDIAGYRETLEKIRLATKAAELHVTCDGFDDLDNLLKATEAAVDAACQNWRDQVTAMNLTLSAGTPLCPALRIEDVARHVRYGLDEIENQSRNHGNPLELRIGDELVGTIGCYEASIVDEVLVIDGKSLSEPLRFPLQDIHAVTSNEQLTFLVGSPLLKPGVPGYVDAKIVSIRPDVSWQNAGDPFGHDEVLTSAFTEHDEGFHILAPGRYVILGSPRCEGLADHPDLEDDVYLNVQDEITLVTDAASGIPFLVVPTGEDRAGGHTRAIRVGESSIVARGMLAIAPITSASPNRQNPYASHCELYHAFTVTTRATVDLSDDALSLIVDGHEMKIDLWQPATFDVDGITFDFEDEGVAKALGYGTDDFEQSVDEHGIFMDLAVAASRLRGHGDVAEALADRLEASSIGIGILQHS